MTNIHAPNGIFSCFIYYFINPHMLKIFLQLYGMKWVPRNPPKEILN